MQFDRFSVNELTTLHWSFQEDAEEYAKRGFGGIGVMRHKVQEFGYERSKELLEELGLTVTSLNWAGGFTGDEIHSLEESKEDAIDAIYEAAYLKAECLILHIGSRNGHTKKTLAQIRSPRHQRDC